MKRAAAAFVTSTFLLGASTAIALAQAPYWSRSSSI